MTDGADTPPDGSGPEAAAGDELAREVWEGLQDEQKHVSSRFFYDHRGSELFEEITELEEYYPTRTETTLLRRYAAAIIKTTSPLSILELGAGSARKTRILLDALESVGGTGHFLPQDVSRSFLRDTADTLREEYPWLDVTALVGDLREPVPLPEAMERPLLVCFLGSTLGNFSDAQALGVLANISQVLEEGDHFLLGLDMRPGGRKSRDELEAAYNDSRGVTAEFNLNALRVLNRQVGTDFDIDAFRHRAFYDEIFGRVEMHLVAEAPVTVRVPGFGSVEFEAGETVRTELSCKYDRPSAESMLEQAGLAITDWITDEHDRYALAIGGLA